MQQRWSQEAEPAKQSVEVQLCLRAWTSPIVDSSLFSGSSVVLAGLLENFTYLCPQVGL